MKIFTYPSKEAKKKINSITKRELEFNTKDYEIVEHILNDVKKNGDKALIKYTNKFDAPNLSISSIKITDNEIKEAYKKVDTPFINALDTAISQIKEFHKHQMVNSWIDTKRSGVFLGQMVNPVNAAGIYVPGSKGGTTPLVSTVLMGAIPAKIAGVNKISMVTPPTEKGEVSPHILVAADKTGVNQIYKAGSAWAIGALTYGTESIDKVDVIVGPGNIYVTLAKKIVSGTVGIDTIAGPSEILVIADSTSNPDYIAADLLSQAEHDPMASSILITDNKNIALSVAAAVNLQIKTLSRKIIAEKSIANYGFILLTDNIITAIDIANTLAPEHLELQIENPFKYLSLIKNAGAVFMGNYTPEPVGDYMAGPNHVLPTAGTARFASALSVENFLKKTSLIHYSKEAFKKEADKIILLAEIEGLSAHTNSIKIRLEK